MNYWLIVFLAVVQGATEFIPISSSAHLVIIPAILKLPQPPLFFDVSLHFGTLLALLIYFRGEIIDFFSLKKKNFPLLKAILVASIPAVLSGSLAHDFFESFFSRAFWAALFLTINGLILFAAQWLAVSSKEGIEINFFEALMIGVAQAFAIFPGISRSGATISAGILLGLKREEAARFSFILGIPIIFGSFVFELKKILFSPIPLTLILVGTFFSFLTGYLVIDFLLKYLKKGSLYPFAVYCLLVGVAGIWWLK